MRKYGLPTKTLTLILILILILTITNTIDIVDPENKEEPTPVKKFTVDNFEVIYEKESDKNPKIVSHKMSNSEFENLKQKIGIREKNKNYNQIINGYGTGLTPPTTMEWEEIAENIEVIDEITLEDQNDFRSPSVDNSIKPWFPPIGNQGSEGSCVTWAVGYYVKTFQEAKENAWNLSQAQYEGTWPGYPNPEYQDKIISPDFLYHLINGGIDSGSSYYDAINLVCSIGASSWEKMPYDQTDHTSWPSKEAWNEAPLFRGNSSSYLLMNPETDADIQNLKNWIATENLATISIDANQYENLTTNDLWTIDNYINPNTNHANTIVGYNDTYEYTENGETRYGAFKIANSWGIGNWENINDGFYWISYETMKQRVNHCWFYSDLIDYEPQLMASFNIDHPKRNECNIVLGIGEYTDPNETKWFNQFMDGGAHPFCENDILLDITEFKETLPLVYNETFFLAVSDGGTGVTGTINKYAIEHAISQETPLNTNQGDTVHVEVILTPPPPKPVHNINTNLNYTTIQAAIDAPDTLNGHTIFVENGIYNENLALTKSISLIGEQLSATVINGTGGIAPVVNVTDINNLEISEFTIQNGAYCGGIFIQNSSNVIISCNNITDNPMSTGISLNDCKNCFIINNIINDNDYGVSITKSPNCTLSGNILESNYYIGFTIYNSSNFIAFQNNISESSYYGIELQHSHNGTISQNNILNYSLTGLLIDASSNNTIMNNTILNNNEGIVLQDSSDFNEFTNNTIENIYGINIFESSNNTFYSNQINHNTRGIRLRDSNDNIFFHNNFVNNTIQASTESSSCTWDSGYPSGGNYWCDYVAINIYSGSNQDEPGSDIIWDQPYVINDNNQDQYPLTRPWLCEPMKFGINYFSTHTHYEPHYLSDEELHRDFALFQEQGLEYITLCAIWKYHEPELGVYNETAINDLIRVCDFASQYNLKVIINVYTKMQIDSWTMPEWLSPRKFETVFLNSTAREAWLNFLEHLAESLDEQESIWSWNMMNEPARREWGCNVTIAEFIQLWSEMKDIFKAHSDRPVSVRFTPQDIEHPEHFNNTQEIYTFFDYLALNYYKCYCPIENFTRVILNAQEINCPVIITEFGSNATDGDQQDTTKIVKDYQGNLTLFRSLGLTDCLAYMWRAENDLGNPNLPGYGWNLALDIIGTPSPAFYLLDNEYELNLDMEGSGSTDPIPGSYMYTYDAELIVTASPDSGWNFDHWELDGDALSDDNSCNITMDSPHSLTAIFVEITPTLKVDGLRSWYWTDNTTINSIVEGDVDMDGSNEIVTAGYYFDGTRDVAQLVVWDGSTLTVDRLTTWYWTNNTRINSVAVGNLDEDEGLEIVTGGYYYDNTRKIAQLVVWDGSTLAVEGIMTWYWTTDTEISSIKIADVDDDGATEIITAGYFNDDVRDVAQLVVWNGTTLEIENLTTWYWTGDTRINSIYVENVDGDDSLEIVTGGYHTAEQKIAQLVIWDCINLSPENIATWYWTNDTVINSVVATNVDEDENIEIVTGGYFNDNSRDVAQLVIWSNDLSTVENLAGWYWTGDTRINSIEVGDADSDGTIEIVTAGHYNDLTRDIAQLVIFDPSTLNPEYLTSWYWTNSTTINDITISNTDYWPEIITGGSYHDNTRNWAQTTIWQIN